MESPRIGVFICTCDDALSSRIRINDLVSYAASLDNVEYSGTAEISASGAVSVKNAVTEHKLDRAVIAPSLDDDNIIAAAAEDAGISPHCIEYANIREQAALIHSSIDDATEKGKLLISMAVAKAGASKTFGTEGAEVNQETCSGCGICAATCRYDAISISGDGEHKTAHIDESSCQRCGACVAACPSGSLNMGGFSNEAVISEIDACTSGLLESKEPFPRIIVFACSWCSYPAADAAGSRGLEIDPSCCLIKIPCSARVDPEWVMKALSQGADGVLVLGGKERHCHYRGGNVRTNNRMRLLSRVLESLGYDERRIKADWVNPDEPELFAKIIKSFVKDIKDTGPNPERGIPPEERPTCASRQ